MTADRFVSNDQLSTGGKQESAGQHVFTGQGSSAGHLTAGIAVGPSASTGHAFTGPGTSARECSGTASGPSAGLSTPARKPAGFTKKDPSQIVDHNVKYELKDVGKLSRALALHVYFGESVLRDSIPCGKGNLPPLTKISCGAW